jgi:hypothetical protein
LDKKTDKTDDPAESDKPDEKAGSADKNKKSSGTEDVLNYFEKKFEIKE